MKKQIKLRMFCGLFLSLFIPLTAFSQAGLTNSGLTQQQEIQKNQTSSGFDNSKKSSTSAIQQLENMTGQKISRYNSGNSQTNRTTDASSAASLKNSAQMQLASGIATAFFSLLFNGNSQSNQEDIEEQRINAALLVQRAAEEKRYNDSIAQTRYEKMMQSYKLLNNSNNIQFKQISTSNLQFKQLDNNNIPMSSEERERLNLIKRGIKVTWDYNSWSQISPNNNKIEETPNVLESNGPDEFITKAIDKIETFEGGRVAALAGRYMKNIKNETMSYIKDASDAAVSGNIARMDEVAQFDLRKLSSNALYSTGKETLNAYIEQAKGFISGKMNDKNFEIMQSGGLKLLQKYNIYSHVSDDWKVFLQKY